MHNYLNFGLALLNFFLKLYRFLFFIFLGGLGAGGPLTVLRVNYLEIREFKQLHLHCLSGAYGQRYLLVIPKLLTLLWDGELRCFCSVILAVILVVHL